MQYNTKQYNAIQYRVPTLSIVYVADVYLRLPPPGTYMRRIDVLSWVMYVLTDHGSPAE